MRVSIKLFGPQARLAGAASIAVELPNAVATAEEVLAALGRAEPRLAPTLSGSRLAVNQEFAAPDDAVSAGDEVALVGMVSGG